MSPWSEIVLGISDVGNAAVALVLLRGLDFRVQEHAYVYTWQLVASHGSHHHADLTESAAYVRARGHLSLWFDAVAVQVDSLDLCACLDRGVLSEYVGDAWFARQVALNIIVV